MKRVRSFRAVGAFGFGVLAWYLLRGRRQQVSYRKFKREFLEPIRFGMNDYFVVPEPDTGEPRVYLAESFNGKEVVGRRVALGSKEIGQFSLRELHRLGAMPLLGDSREAKKVLQKLSLQAAG